MANADIFVAFGADTGGLEAALALTKAQVSGFQTELNKLGKEMANAGKESERQFATAMTFVANDLAKAKEQAKGFSDQLKETGGAAPALAHGVEQVTAAVSHGHTGFGFYLRELHALSDEFGSGRTRQGIGTLSNLIFTFLQSNTQIIPYAAAIAALGAAFGYVAYQAYEANKAIKGVEFDAALNQINATRQASAELVSAVTRLGNVGASDAREFIEQFLKLGPAGEAISVVASRYLPAFIANGQTAKEAGEKLSKSFEDIAKGGGEVIANSRVLTEEEKRKAQAFIAASDSVNAYKFVLEILSRSLSTVADEARKTKTESDNFALAAKLAASDTAGFASAETMLAIEMASTTQKTREQEEEFGRWALKAAMATDQAGRLAAAMRDALKVDKTSADIKDLEGKVKE